MQAVGSTMDIAHRLASEGTPAGTLVLADQQTAGRGRGGKVWDSAPGQGIWMTLIERPRDERAIEVLSIRVGLAAAKALDRFAEEPIRLKWPNDLYTSGKKLAGILVEARWREGQPEWVAIGIGINVITPEGVETGIGLEPGTSRLEVLEDGGRKYVWGQGLAAELDGAGPQRELENARLGLEAARQWIDVVEDRLEREELAE